MLVCFCDTCAAAALKIIRLSDRARLRVEGMAQIEAPAAKLPVSTLGASKLHSSSKLLLLFSSTDAQNGHEPMLKSQVPHG